MSQLHVFVDGTWLFRICAAGKVLATKTENGDRNFSLDFDRLNEALLAHVRENDNACTRLGERYLSTSVFEVPATVDEWPEQDFDITTEAVQKVKRGTFARDMFARHAIAAGYQETAIFRVPLRPYMLEKVAMGKYQEKQVDTTVVALLVRSAITQADDYHVVLTGDSDILPAIRVAYPEYTRNVVIATSHPDELSAEHRHTSFSLNNFDFNIPPFFFQDHIADIIHGENVYHCGECHKVFTRPNPLPNRARPYCCGCRAMRS